jgi:hypothetical protein
VRGRQMLSAVLERFWKRASGGQAGEAKGDRRVRGKKIVAGDAARAKRESGGRGSDGPLPAPASMIHRNCSHSPPQ